MAEESIDLLVTPEKNEFAGRTMAKNSAGNPGSLNNGRSTYAHQRRASIGSYHTGDSSRRYSTEKLDSATISQDTVPHYLRASTGSCHDFCKYGGRHAFEEKARQPLRKRIAKPSPDEPNSVEVILSGKQRKEKVAKQKQSTATKKRSPEVKPSPNTKSYSPELKTSLDAKTYSPRQCASSGNLTRLPKYKPSTNKKSPSSDPPEIIKREILLPSKTVAVPVEEGYSIDNKMSRNETKTDDQSMKRSSSVKSKPVKDKPSSSSQNSDSICGKGRRNSDVKTGRNMTASKASLKKALAPLIAPLSPKLSLSKTASSKARKAGKLKLVSPLKDRNRMQRFETETSNNEVSEKPLHVLNAGAENNAVEYIPNDHAIASLPSPSSPSHAKPPSLSSHEEHNEETEYNGTEADEFVPENNISIEIGTVQPVKENKNKILRKSRVVVAEDKYRSPAKLKFRSGKVLDLQSDNNSPRRLTFRRARISGIEADEFVSDNNESIEIGNIQPVKENHNKTLRKIRVVVSEDKYHSPVKLKFRCGKVVDPQSDNNNPRRLRFRRARVGGNKADEFVSDKNESLDIGNVRPVKENHNKTLRKCTQVVSEDKYQSPVKLFRSGNVVDLQPFNNSPRRLRFRRARVLGAEDGKGDLRRRNFGKAGDKNDATGAELSSGKIILKHQDVQGKKDAQGLYNNVIEETASKLVESRKSKVKALVGAFETVISLQEHKPSSSTVER